MKFTVVFTLAFMIISCLTQPEKVMVKSLRQSLIDSDSTDVWLSQWRTSFELGSDKPGVSESIYGAAVIIFNDSLYFLSSESGYYGNAKFESESKMTFNHENITKSIKIFEDSMFIQFDDFYKVWTYEPDTTKYTLVSSHIRKRVNSKEVLKVINNGKIVPPDWEDTMFLGLNVSGWVELNSPRSYKLSR